jgi:hypothetical protein
MGRSSGFSAIAMAIQLSGVAFVGLHHFWLL